jgi:CBS domain-containing protein
MRQGRKEAVVTIRQNRLWQEIDMSEAHTIMKTDLITVNTHTPIYEAIATLVENNITGLPVANDDMTLAGIITEKDVLKLLYDIEDKPGTVENFMTQNVVSFDCQDDLIDIADSFRKGDFRRVPILERGKLVGIISRKDVIAHIAKLRHKDKAVVQK